VLRVLARHNIPIDFIAGTSIGAFVGAHYALYQDLTLLHELTVGKKKEKMWSMWELSFRGGLIKGGKIERLFDEWFEQKKFSDTKIPLRLVATDFFSGKQVLFSRGSLAEAVHASIAIPALFEPVPYKKTLLVDGGLCNPVPDDVVKQMGADVIIGVNLDAFKNGTPRPEKLGFTSVALRTMEISRHYLSKYSMQSADVAIEPAVAKYASWREYFTSERGPEVVAAGERAAEKMMPKIKLLLGM
jgi:NTE family protein